VLGDSETNGPTDIVGEQCASTFADVAMLPQYRSLLTARWERLWRSGIGPTLTAIRGLDGRRRMPTERSSR
jgi:hypothetical protein